MNKLIGKSCIHRSLILLVLLMVASCTKNLHKETTVFLSDFEDAKIGEIFNSQISDFNGSKVLGRYNVGGFDLFLDSLPEHDLIQISFDLYIHDNWKGNSPTGVKDSSDIWIMNIDGGTDKYTTFSNGWCTAEDCTDQSFPDNFPFKNNPAKANAIRTDLPGACALKEVPGGTIQYKIQRTVYHTSSTLHLGCYGQLFRHISEADPACSASWSVDNLKITTTRFRN